MKCYILSRDLMFSSQVTSDAKQMGLEPQTIGSAADVAEPDSLVVLDLGGPGLDVGQVVEALASMNAKLIAVAPHVHEAKLEAAKAAGAYRVLTKGQAHRELKSVLQAALLQ